MDIVVIRIVNVAYKKSKATYGARRIAEEIKANANPSLTA